MRKLLAVDGSEFAQRALKETLARVEATGDELAIAIFRSDQSNLPLSEIESSVRSITDRSDLEVPIYRLDSHPGSDLVELADGHDFDRLLIGVRSRTPLGKIQLSDIAKFAVLNAETSITLVRSLGTQTESHHAVVE